MIREENGGLTSPICDVGNVIDKEKSNCWRV